MIFGVGIDIIEVNRIEKSLKNDHFKNRVFTSKEINYCEKRSGSFQSYAARFAAKEAFFKALGLGWRDGMAWTEIEIINDELGKPEFVFYGKTKSILDDKRITKSHVSLSHIKEMATAYVLLEQEIREEK
jgi:holo-[acyl-carrier protein] synthase